MQRPVSESILRYLLHVFLMLSLPGFHSSFNCTVIIKALLAVQCSERVEQVRLVSAMLALLYGREKSEGGKKATEITEKALRETKNTDDCLKI